MRVQDLLYSALNSLRRTKARSAMTTLGIVIGIMSVILVLSIGESAQSYIVNQVAVFGSDLLFMENGANPLESSGTPSPFVKESITKNDYSKLREQPWITQMTGDIQQNDTVIANGQEFSAQVVGGSQEEPLIYSSKVAQGVFFDESQVNSRARVIVLGSDVAKKLFGEDTAIGKLVKVSSRNFRVVGVMASGGSRFMQSVDNQVYIPFTTAMDLYHKKYLLYVVYKVNIPVTDAKRRTEEFMRERHDILDAKDDDFYVSTQEDVVRQTGQITQILQILLGSIAGISLFVGGIGIMNIMYVSVTERVREIGLRKAMGAKQSEILGQFLIESLVLTTLGGIIGTLLGISLTWLAIQVILQFQDGWTFSVSYSGILMGILVSSIIGIVFGYAPAKQAAKLDPIVALRKE